MDEISPGSCDWQVSAIADQRSQVHKFDKIQIIVETVMNELGRSTRVIALASPGPSLHTLLIVAPNLKPSRSFPIIS